MFFTKFSMYKSYKDDQKRNASEDNMKHTHQLSEFSLVTDEQLRESDQIN